MLKREIHTLNHKLRNIKDKREIVVRERQLLQERIDTLIGSIGKKHAFKRYDPFTLNTSCFWGEVPDQILPQLYNFTNFFYQNNE